MPVAAVPTRDEHWQETLAHLVSENDDLKAENRRLVEEIADLKLERQRKDELFSIYEVAEMLDARGYAGLDWTTTEVAAYAFEHPDWFRGSLITPAGVRFVRYTVDGLMFTWDGVEAIIEQFCGAG